MTNEFKKIIKDFICDILNTFPEYKNTITWWKTIDDFNYIEDKLERNQIYDKYEKENINMLFEFCKKKYPPRFFDILYQNEEIFQINTNSLTEIDTEFLPNIYFKDLWKIEGISEKIKETIWKYLQLLLFTIINSIQNKEEFGETANLFEAINEENFKNKLEEVLGEIQNMFDLSNNPLNFGDMERDGIPDCSNNFFNSFEGFNNFDSSGINMNNLPNVEQLNDHISGILNGKLGKLAMEIAEETAGDLSKDFSDSTDMKDVFTKLIKNPSKLMELVKTVSEKLNTKMQSGDIKESEMLEEATALLNNMKDIPGMDGFKSIFQKMGLGGGAKFNTNLMSKQLNNKLKLAKTKERLLSKIEKKKETTNILKEAELLKQKLKDQPSIEKITENDDELCKLFLHNDKSKTTNNNFNSKKGCKKVKK